jgi:hypothetical protein
MKKLIFIALGGILFLVSCQNTLDLYPLSTPTSESWYSNETEIKLALNDLYRPEFWVWDDEGGNYNSDDGFFRDTPTELKLGTITSQFGQGNTLWTNSYKAIARSNRSLEALNSEQSKSKIPKVNLQSYIGEVRFHRAQQYAMLISHFGDVVYLDHTIALDEAYTKERTDKNIVLQKIYADFDSAALVLPKSYSTSVAKRVTKGAAYAFKARIALYMGDYKTAATAAKACMDLGEYTLHSDFANLFLQSTHNAKEVIFALPRSIAEKVVYRRADNRVTRNGGGFAGDNPTWDLFCSFLCTDGLPIDKSPLYNPQKPFLNRDPRCTATIVEFGTAHLGFIYDPNPYTLKVLNVNTNVLVTNNDNRVNAQFASFNGLVWKKRVDNSWVPPLQIENDQIMIRYADVLLMYAEAKFELGEIDQSVLDASLNLVRARAYKVAVTAKTLYPAVLPTTPNLRTIIRTERRMELADEGLRLMDIVRWKIASKVLNRPIYGMLDIADLKSKVVDKGLWFFPGTPVIDEDGAPDFSALETAGLIKRLVKCNWPDRQYLWPIPTSELQINPNMKQNPGY